MTRLRIGALAALAGAVALFAASAARAGGVLTVGMTAGDLPVTTGTPDQGAEGLRFVGYNLYDALTLWNLRLGDQPTDIKPGLATSWHIDPDNHKRWIFELRHGVKWHDGCDFTADDVLWNMKYSADDKAPEFNPAQFAQARAYLGTYQSVEKIDDKAGCGIDLTRHRHFDAVGMAMHVMAAMRRRHFG